MPELFGQHMWAAAETAAEGFMRDLGFADAEVTQGSGDGGVDVLSERAVAQSKYQGKPVGREPVQRIRGVAFDREALFFSWSGYTRGAVEFAREAGVALFDVPNGEPVACSPAAEELLGRAAEARQRRAEAEAAAAAAAVEAERAAERRSLESEQRLREANAKATAARIEKAAANARRLAVAAEQRAARRRRRRERRERRRHSSDERRVERRRTIETRRDERKTANAPKVAERAARRAQLDSLPGFTRNTRTAALVGTLGVLLPLGFGFVAGWFALRARTTLSANGVGSSPALLRYAAVVSTIGIGLTIALLVSLPVTLGNADDEPPEYAGALYATIWVIVGVLAVVAWNRSRTVQVADS